MKKPRGFSVWIYPRGERVRIEVIEGIVPDVPDSGVRRFSATVESTSTMPRALDTEQRVMAAVAEADAQHKALGCFQGCMGACGSALVYAGTYLMPALAKAGLAVVEPDDLPVAPT